MKTIKLTIILLFITILNTYGQTEMYLTCTRLSTIKKQINVNPATYQSGSYDCESRLDTSATRTIWQITIPSGIKERHIKTAILEYANAETNYFHKFVLDQLNGYNSSGTYGEKWANTENVSLSSIVSEYPYAGVGAFGWMTESFITALNNAIDNSVSTLYFSIRCDEEFTRYVPRIAFQSISIKLIYENWTQHTISNSPAGGSVFINSQELPSGTVAKQAIGTTVSLGAKSPQTIGADTYVWNSGTTNTSNWYLNFPSGSMAPVAQQISYTTTTTDRFGTCTDYLKLLCKVTIQNNLTDGIPILTDNSNTVIEGNTITVYSNNNLPTSDGLYKVFNRWSDGSTAVSKTVTTSTHTSLTALYRARPTNSYRSMYYYGNVGDYITLRWTDHSSSNVGQYQIYRKVKQNGVWGAEVFLGNVNSGVGTYTDYTYVYTDGYTNDMLQYDVRAVYTGNDNGTQYTTYADPEFLGVYGRLDASQKSKNNSSARIAVVPTEYALGAYPNPFNPTTVIRYSMPEAGQVSLKVYNILSQEVASLVEESKSAGVHAVNFNAGNLPTGTYIARLQAGAKVMSIKLQLVK